MLKKAGIITVGVSAALVAASPMAFAGNSTDSADNGGHSSHDHGHGDHGKGHGKQHGVGNTSCASESGAVKDNHTSGILALGPILDGNSGQLLSCNSFLNDVASHNLNHTSIDVL